MENLTRWNLMFGNNSSPCFITDLETERLVYVNQQLLTMFQLEPTIIGKVFYNVIINDNAMYDDIRPDWNIQDSFETDVFNRKTNQSFHGTSILINEGKNMFCELKPFENEETQKGFEEAMTECMTIFEKKGKGGNILEDFSRLLGKFYQSQLAFVYRFEQDTITCIGHWASPDFVPSETGTSTLGPHGIIDWFKDKNTPYITFAQKGNDKLEPTLKDIITTFPVNNVVFCKIEDGNGEIVGYVGVSNRKDCERYFDRRLITTISRFVAQDVTKGLVDASLFQLHHKDMLTGLTNRVGYSKRIDKLLVEKPKTMGVISVNVNGMKLINQNIGIEGGDEHIKKAAQRLTNHFSYEFFRLSGDEFVGIAPGVDKDEFEAVITKLHDVMAEEENYDFSMGFAWGKGNFDFYKLVQEAEIVMYINKQEYYAVSKRHFETVNDTILSELLSYLANDEFMIYLQPQVKLEDSSLYGAEALIRRYDKTNEKMVFPDQFIPLYEQKSVIRHVDMFVVETVCSLLARWGKEGKAIPIAVNLSRVTLMEHGIVENIVKICAKHKVPHNLVVIEVTERVGLIENNVASTLITAFKDHGFSISLDDFGCAYSNIVTLAQIEVDEVKIDKSLVDDLTTSKKNHILVKNVLTMCNELEGASTLAEGIEDESQAQLLHELNCHLGQGYFYSRPIPVAEFEEQYIK